MNGWHKVLDSGAPADIGLMLEGTYPYVSGGVSSWVNQIIRAFPELTFALVFLGGAREHYDTEKYPLPDNVVHLERHYLIEIQRGEKTGRAKGDPATYARVRVMHDALRQCREGALAPAMTALVQELGQEQGLTLESFLHSHASWEQITEQYSRYCTDPSFVSYFWTVRMMHAPIFRLAALTDGVPPVRALHSVSTGYAGFLAMLLHHKRQLPLILSEHGIYTKERKIDLAQADWIDDPRETFGSNLDADVSYMRRLWIRFFEGLGHLTYNAADPIISLYEGNRRRQIEDGAAAERTQVIPNGINLERFAPLRAQRPQGVPPILGLIGRVVPIKDIKTFIRAMRTVCNVIPEAEGWIVGPEDEDPAYAKECRALVANLGLEQNVKFLGFQKVEDIFRQIGLLLLTSISEALPLVILEGYASGVPAVATDVGSCRELIEGGRDEDRALGRSGGVVPIANPEATARAALALLQDEAAWRAAQTAAIARVERWYDQQDMFAQYRAIYRQALDGQGES